MTEAVFVFLWPTGGIWQHDDGVLYIFLVSSASDSNHRCVCVSLTSCLWLSASSSLVHLRMETLKKIVQIYSFMFKDLNVNVNLLYAHTTEADRCVFMELVCLWFKHSKCFRCIQCFRVWTWAKLQKISWFTSVWILTNLHSLLPFF